jgi:hypothetical protein
MRIHARQVGQIVLSALQGAKELDGKLELKVGTVVRATLLKHVGKDEVLLQIGGKHLRARLEANLKPGEQVDLLVTGEQKQGAMELKVVGQPTRSGDGGKAVDIPSLVRALGLPETPETKALIQEFALRGAALRQETVRAALTVLRGLPHVTSSHIATLGKMAELGIPIFPGTFEAMHTLDFGPKLHDLLTKIQTALQPLFPDDAPTGESGQAGAGTAESNSEQVKAGIRPAAEAGKTETAQSTAEVLKAGTAQAATEAGKKTLPHQTSEAMRAGTAQSATDAGKKALAHQTPATAKASTQSSLDTGRAGVAQSGNTSIAQPATTNHPATDAGKSAPPQLVSNAGGSGHFPENTPRSTGNLPLSAAARTHLEQLLHITRQLLQSIDDTAQIAEQLSAKTKQLGINFEEQLAHALRRLPADSDLLQISNAFNQALKNAAESGVTLKQALLFAQTAAAELEEAGHGSLQQDISTLLKNITGQQLMQTAGSDRTDLLYQFTAVPVRHGEHEQTVELHVMARKGPGQKAIDPANCYVLFRLDMPNLGELDIHLHIVDKVVGVRFLTDNKAALHLSAAEQRDLRSALQSVGFHLGVLKVEHKQQSKANEHQPLLPPVLTQRQFDQKI